MTRHAGMQTGADQQMGHHIKWIFVQISTNQVVHLSHRITNL